MWKVKVLITLTDDDTTESKEIQVCIEESIPHDFQSLDSWEGDVRNVGFRAMRELFKSGIKLFEDGILSRYVHKSKRCKLIRKGKLDFGIATLFGRIIFKRQRMLCKRCNKWLTPLNDALGIHDDEHERSTLGFKELSCLCAAHQPYRQATQMIKQITHDMDVVCHEQVRQIAQTEGKLVRQREEEDRSDAAFCFVRAIQNKPHRPPPASGRLYICLDGTFVRSSAGFTTVHFF